MFRFFISLIFIVSSTLASAQQNDSQPSVIEQYGPRRQISTIVYTGLAGAVLGLSTLSFYGRPQDHLTNIPIGFGAGVLIGTIFMTYQAATDPDEFYRKSEYKFNPRQNLFAKNKRPLLESPLPRPMKFNYNFQF